MSSQQHLGLLAVGLATAISCSLPFSLAAAAAPGPARTPAGGLESSVPHIADLRPAHVELNQANLNPAQEFEVRTLDASFVKVHFAKFSLPAGVTLEVFSPDGSEVYRYSKNQRDAFTSDAAQGDNGSERFSSMSISGPVAKLRLIGTPVERWTANHGVVVDKYLEGYPADMLAGLQNEGLLTSGPQPEAICGADDKQAVACYQSSDATAYDRSRPVAKLILGSGGACTAWRVGPNNHLFTNNHCFTTTAEVAASEIWFNYQASACGSSTGATVTKVTGATMLKTDTTLDYTLFTVNNFATLAGFGYLGLDNRTPVTGEEIFIPQHPGARMKELAIASDQNGGRCKINTATQNGNGTNTDAGYQCDTEPGSSGSPVIARSSSKVVALHHLGGCNNSGAQISQIWPQVSSFFGGVVPSGDTGGGGGNSAPVASFAVSTSGLTASFTDSSTDADGSIVSRSWNFGDGTTSTATSPGKTYAAAGTYNVTLTVTDNAGASNSTSKSVTVSSGTALILTNGVPVTGLSAATGASITYVMNVPTASTGLKFEISGGTGDADLYVKFGSAATDTVYDCRPYLSGNTETCNIATVQAGTYYVRVKAYAAFSGLSLKGSWSTAGLQFSSNTVYNILDNATINSPITVSGVGGNAPATLKVNVNITHTYQGDLKVDLVAPNGTLINLWNRTGGGTDNIIQTFTVNASALTANGTWNLRVQDAATGDTGKLNSWSLQF